MKDGAQASPSATNKSHAVLLDENFMEFTRGRPWRGGVVKNPVSEFPNSIKEFTTPTSETSPEEANF